MVTSSWKSKAVAVFFQLGAQGVRALTGVGPVCRYTPSCSRYAQTAFQCHGPGKAAALVLGRLFRCRPGGGWGHDPVPHSARHLQST